MKIKLPAPVAKLAFKANQHSPTLLLAGGAAAVVASTVMACKATLKLEKLLQEQGEKSEVVRETDLEESEKTKLLVGLRTQTAFRITRLYLPAVGIGVAGLGCFVVSNRVLAARNTALVAAYAGLERTFDAYRSRVLEELGEEKEREIYYGSEVEIVTDEKGNTKTQLKAGASKYAFFFDEYSSAFSESPQANQLWLRAQQSYANDLLNARGHVFLNEIHDMMGVPRTAAGALVGWLRDNNENGDNYIDFGVFDGDIFQAMQFVNGNERSILLDPNVDGVIWDKI